MPRQITIGRAGNQPFSIQDPKVGRQHALLDMTDDGRYYLTDCNSTNGTFIYQNGEFRRLPSGRPCLIAADAMIRLGPETQFHVYRLTGGQAPQRRHQTPPPQDPTVDISNLRHIEEIYKDNKRNYEGKLANINGYRSFTIMISMLVMVISGVISKSLDLDKDDELYAMIASVAIGAILMVTLLLVINHFNNKYRRILEDNDKQYSVRYCCPRCGMSFRGQYYENILSQRACPRCKAKFRGSY